MVNLKQKVLMIIAVLVLIIITTSIVNAADANSRISGRWNKDVTADLVSRAGWTQSDTVIIVSGADFPDALCAGPLEKKFNAPILLACSYGQNYLSSVTTLEIERLNAKKAIIIGGTGALNSSIESQVPNPIRLSGKDRYETNLAVLKQFTSNLKFNKVYIATGNDYSDALVGSTLAAKTQAPVVLVDKNLTGSLQKYIVNNKTANTNVIVIVNFRDVYHGVFDEAQGITVNKQPHTVDSMANEIIAEVIKPGMSDFEKELALHDYIVDNAINSDDSSNGGLRSIGDVGTFDTAESVLLKGKVVGSTGNGFAEAMNLLLNKVAIQSQVVNGQIRNGVSWWYHQPNIVKVNGDCYQLDVYSDLPACDGSYIDLTPDHTYFNVTDEVLSKDHLWNSSAYPKRTAKYSLNEKTKENDNSTKTDNDTENNDGNKTNEPIYHPSDNTLGIAIPPNRGI